MTNNWGGMMTLTYYMAAVIFAILLILTFHYTNVSETRSSLPAVVAGRRAFSQIEITVTTRGDRDPSNCVTEKNECIPGMVLEGAGFLPGEGNKYDKTCTFKEPRYCIAFWKCSNCTVESVEAYLEVVFFEEDWFSSLTQVEIKASSGVPEDEPAIAYAYAEPDNETVFLGYPSTIFVAEVTQTLTRAPHSSWNQQIYEKSGYHVRFLQGLTQRGNQIEYTEFPHTYRVPSRIVLREPEQVLLITRFTKSPVVDLVSSVIGGVSGLAGLFILIMGFMDMAAATRRQRQQQQAREAATRESAESAPNDEDEGPLMTPRTIQKYLKDLLVSNLTYVQAKAIFNLVRKAVEERRRRSTIAGVRRDRKTFLLGLISFRART